MSSEVKQDHECSYCLKVFHSKATLDIHLMTKRHDWQLKKAIENMDSINNNFHEQTIPRNGE